MDELDALIERLRLLEKDPERERQNQLYLERALRECEEKGYFTAAPLGTDRLEDPFSITLHPLPLPGPHIPLLHCHQYFELVYAARGSCRQVVQGGERYEILLSQGETLLMNPRAVHDIRTFSEEDAVFNFLIPEETFHRLFPGLWMENGSLLVMDLFYQMDASADYLIGGGEEAGPLAQILDRLILENDKRLPGYENILLLGLGQVFCYMARGCLDRLPGPGRLPASEPLREMLVYILKNYADVTLKEVAEAFHYHEKYVSRLIREKMGVPFSELVQTIRLRQAASLLRQTTMAVQRVASSVGYQNLSYFYRLFEEEYHCTPSQYRLQGSVS